ncbi:MAG: hypothetical protein DCE92_01915 [Alphaproteobacteria bacterium]|nr:MAG: hypothetical protein DCE92_01915 [Alphaproteobacteria bacterium]
MEVKLKTAYAEILKRVADAEAKKPNPLRSALTELFINHPAIKPHDECSPATAKMVRYQLSNGASLGHQIEGHTQHLWIAQARAPKSLASAKLYPATTDGEGRHSNIQQMPDMRDEAVLRLTVTDIEEAEQFLNGMLS